MILTLILLQISFASWTESPNPANSQEQTEWLNKGSEDWTYKFDQPGWHELAGQQLMIGWIRSGNAANNEKDIHHLDGIVTAEPGVDFLESQCEDVDWTLTLDNSHVWADCGANKALHGLYRTTTAGGLSNIEKGRCCPGVTNNCYYDTSVGFELDFAGEVKCQPGHAIRAFYKGSCNDLHCVEKFFCCRLVKWDPNDVHVIGYWTKDTFQRQPFSNIIKTIEKKMSSEQTDELSSSESNEWYNEVSETHSVTVAVEASAEYGAASGSISSEYGYENSQTHGQSFMSSLSSTVTETYGQEITVTETFEIPKQVEGESIYANVWYFKSKAIKPDLMGGYDESSHSLLANGITKTGCGYDLAPNCLPGHCASNDPQCFECTENKWRIDPDFQNPCDLNCCDAIELSGYPEGVQWDRDGTFVKVDGVIQDHLPVYKNDDEQYLFYWGEHQAWRVGPDYTNALAGVMSGSGNKDCPETFSTWYAYHDGDWLDVSSTASVSCKDLTCCDAYEISGYPDGLQWERDGTFVKVHGVIHDDLPVYENEHGQYLYYWGEFQGWLIGPDYTSSVAGVTASGVDKSCPEAYSTWHVHNNGWVDAGSGVSVTCTNVDQSLCDFVAVSEGECPEGVADLQNTHCVWGMSLGSYCEADGPLPNGNPTYDINNCGFHDIFQYQCSYQTAVGSSPNDLEHSALDDVSEVPANFPTADDLSDASANSQTAVGSSPIDLEHNAIKDLSEAPAKLPIYNAIGIETYSNKVGKFLALFGVGAVIYGMTRCMIRKTEYTEINEPEV